MNEIQANTKITVTCPGGHRLRGGTLLVGKPVCCPKCHAEFVFGAREALAAENRTVSDTAVIRILGEMPAPPAAATAQSPKVEPRSISDTGVMRILGESLPAGRSVKSRVPQRPCTRCGLAIPETAAVCDHCHCYVGELPAFLRLLTR
jgi:hypothetical protein